MSSKTVAVVVVVVLVLLGFYFYSGDEMKPAPATPVVQQSKTVEETSSSVRTVKTPEKNTSTDDIVDYLVDGLSGDEKTTSQASIDSVSAPSQADAGSSLNTNF